MLRSTLLAVAFPAASILLAQGPGGVTTDLAVWYKADLNVVGSPVSAWNTSGGSAAGYNITQGTPGNRPGIIAGSTNYKRYNYNPRIDFSVASSTRLENTGTAPNLYGTAGSVFLVTDQNPAGGNGTALSYSASLLSQRVQIKPSFRFQTSTGVLGFTGDFSPPTEYGNTSASLLTVTGLGLSATQRRNSVPIACSNCGLALYNPAIVTGLRVGRNGGGGEYVDCDLGEVIIYDNSLTVAEMDRIESYLAIKYGITRGGNTGTTSTYNYVNSAGTVIWDKVANAGYNNDIAGIGRDDNSALVQRQSISVNTNESVSIGLVSIDASNAANTNAFSSNNSFVVWGNNGGVQQTLIYDPACFAPLPSGVQARIQRKWKFQITNFAQSATVGFESSSLVSYLPLTNLRLLLDDDGTNWSNATVISGAVMDGARIEFPGVSLTAARPFFTLATTDYFNTPMPVELLAFDAVPEGAKVRLTWSTGSELDNDRFIVERAVDAAAFTPIGTLEGAGTSSVRHDYSMMDGSPLAGTSYYRLRQVDVLGASVLSDVRVITREDDGAPIVYPNPVTDQLRVVGYDPLRHGTISLYNELGDRVPLPPAPLMNGVIDVATLPRGFYVAVIGDHAVRLMKE